MDPNNPLGASNNAEVSKFMESTYAGMKSTAAGNASVGKAQAVVEAAKKSEAEAKQREQDMQDISKYRVGHVENGKFVPGAKADGGFDFFDPDGKQIDIATLSNRTGTKASDVLEKYGSQNPIDIQYIQDTKNLNGLMNAVVSGDKSALASYQKGFTDNGLPDITTTKPQEIIDKYKKYYERYYVTRAQNPNAWGTRPNSSPMVPSPQAGAADYGLGATSGNNSIPGG